MVAAAAVAAGPGEWPHLFLVEGGGGIREGRGSPDRWGVAEAALAEEAGAGAGAGTSREGSGMREGDAWDTRSGRPRERLPTLVDGLDGEAPADVGTGTAATELDRPCADVGNAERPGTSG